MTYFKNGVFPADPWDQTPGPARREILTYAEWQQRRNGAVPAPLGLRLDPGFAVEQLAGDIEHFDLISIGFPKFTDGRGYSMAWLLRSRLGYTKELRATGDVLFDEMQFMVRCGFDAFEISDANTLRLLQEGRRAAAFDRFYQPGLEPEVPAGTRPWARRSA
jgi:phosphoadenosine phosphosulfate reductase